MKAENDRILQGKLCTVGKILVNIARVGCVRNSLKNGRNFRFRSHFREVGIGRKVLICNKNMICCRVYKACSKKTEILL